MWGWTGTVKKSAELYMPGRTYWRTGLTGGVVVVDFLFFEGVAGEASVACFSLSKVLIFVFGGWWGFGGRVSAF